MIKKIRANYLLVTLQVFFLLSFFVSKVEAQDFSVASAVKITFDEEGKAAVEQNISITNLKEFIYTPSFSIQVGVGEIEDVSVTSEGVDLPFEIQESEGSDSITITFPQNSFGRGKSNSFTITYNTDRFIDMVGGIREIRIPGASDPSSFDRYDVFVKVPESFGNAQIVKPHKTFPEGTVTFEFSKEEMKNAGVFIAFGKNRYYRTALHYKLQNSNFFPAKKEIALPPDTSYQNIILKKLTPEPDRVFNDNDGNLIAVYTMDPTSSIEVQAEVLVEVFDVPQYEEEIENEKVYTQADSYWQSSNGEIKKVAKKLSGIEEIYEYVVSHLQYDYGKVNEQNVRVGALKVLKNPEFAVCLEFTDLFVALARAKGIPARSVEGYAFTQNERLRPLSLVEDVLHTWPEYYDHRKKAWVMVDPTWGNTTGGLDYFYSFDFDHIVFVKKGLDSRYPIPAGMYQSEDEKKDVEVEFIGKDAFKGASLYDLEVYIPQTALPVFPIDGYVTVKNTGEVKSEKVSVRVLSELLDKNIQFVSQDIPPGGEKTFKIPLRAASLRPQDYAVRVQTQHKTIDKRISIMYDKGPIFMIGGGFFATAVFAAIAFKTGRIRI